MKKNEQPAKGDWNNVLNFLYNLVKNPVAALYDGSLYLADVAGAPSHVTDYLRDFNVAIPQKISAATRGGIKTLFNDKSFYDNYEKALKDPDMITDWLTINPLVNTNANYSKEELDLLKKMRLPNGSITSKSIKKVNGSYGSKGKLSQMFGPNKTVELSVGQASGNNGYTTDVFDFNTQSQEAKRDNAYYLNAFWNNPGLNYQAIRAIAPFTNSVDIMPNKHKIKTVLDLRK